MLHTFAATDQKLGHWTYVRFSENFIQMEAANSFVDGVKDLEVKQHFLMGSEKSLNEALNQAVKLEAAKE
jgi:hypothetical protein